MSYSNNPHEHIGEEEGDQDHPPISPSFNMPPESMKMPPFNFPDSLKLSPPQGGTNHMTSLGALGGRLMLGGPRGVGGTELREYSGDTVLGDRFMMGRTIDNSSPGDTNPFMMTKNRTGLIHDQGEGGGEKDVDRSSYLDKHKLSAPTLPYPGFADQSRLHGMPVIPPHAIHHRSQFPQGMMPPMSSLGLPPHIKESSPPQKEDDIPPHLKFAYGNPRPWISDSQDILPPEKVHKPSPPPSDTEISVTLIAPDKKEFKMRIDKKQVTTLDGLLQSLQNTFYSSDNFELFYADGKKICDLQELKQNNVYTLQYVHTSNEQNISYPTPNPYFPVYSQEHQTVPHDLVVNDRFRYLLDQNPPQQCLTEKLRSSKTPVIDAFIYCALCGWGVEIQYDNNQPTRFMMTDFTKFYELSGDVCSKPKPTKDPASRLKSLRRWFVDFPHIKKLKESKPSAPLTFLLREDKREVASQLVKSMVHVITTRCNAADSARQMGNFTNYQNM